MTVDIEIFTTPTCPYCKKLKAWLDENDYEYTEYDVSENKEKAQYMVEKTGQRGVPQAFIGNKAVIGFRPEKVEELIDEQEDAQEA